MVADVTGIQGRATEPRLNAQPALAGAAACASRATAGTPNRNERSAATRNSITMAAHKHHKALARASTARSFFADSGSRQGKVSCLNPRAREGVGGTFFAPPP